MNEFLTSIPPPSDKRIAMRVKPAAEKALRRGHPWVFNDSIRRQSREGRAGDLAVIFDDRDRFLAIGLYDPSSPLRVRILHCGQPVTINGDWYRTQLATAFNKRASIEDTDTTGYRLLHGENDGLPGLVIDRYGDSGVVRLDTAAWVPHLANVLAVAMELFSLDRLVLRLSRKVQSKPAALHGLQDGQLLSGTLSEQPLIFTENGLAFEVDLVQGQKTGFFLDQRENRSTLESLIKHDGRVRTVLNMFAYTGGFSAYAARAGVDHLTNVDASDAALATAARNLELNRKQWARPTTGYDAIGGDAFAILEELSISNRRFDVVVIDPPSFASSSRQIYQAKGAYRRLTKLGLALLQPRGLLAMSSCSSRIDADTFFELVNQAAADAGRPLREIVRTGHPADHPIGFPDGAYLKCLFAMAR